MMNGLFKTNQPVCFDDHQPSKVEASIQVAEHRTACFQNQAASEEQEMHEIDEEDDEPAQMMQRLKVMAMHLPEMAKLSENIMQQVCSYESKIN